MLSNCIDPQLLTPPPLCDCTPISSRSPSMSATPTPLSCHQHSNRLHETAPGCILWRSYPSSTSRWPQQTACLSFRYLTCRMSTVHQQRGHCSSAIATNRYPCPFASKAAHLRININRVLQETLQGCTVEKIRQGSLTAIDYDSAAVLWLRLPCCAPIVYTVGSQPCWGTPLQYSL